MMTIVLADDHHVMRQGLRLLLDAEPDLSVVGEAGDGLEALQLVEHFRPDVLVIDLMMPGLGGIEVTRQAGRRSQGTCVVILSMHANEAYVSEALRAGAMAYVLKESTSGELVRAVRQAIAGCRYLSPPLSERDIEAYLEQVHVDDLDPYETLTGRERQVLHLVAEGHTNAEIAGRLHIGQRTVETHRANMMRKLRLRNQTDLARYALKRGIIPIED
jgi:DNA-binding NarL/FixJ family response regulator